MRRRGDGYPLQVSHICRKTFCCPCCWKKRSAPQRICVPRPRRVPYHGILSKTSDVLERSSSVQGSALYIICSCFHERLFVTFDGFDRLCLPSITLDCRFMTALTPQGHSCFRKDRETDPSRSARTRPGTILKSHRWRCPYRVMSCGTRHAYIPPSWRQMFALRPNRRCVSCLRHSASQVPKYPLSPASPPSFHVLMRCRPCYVRDDANYPV